MGETARERLRICQLPPTWIAPSLEESILVQEDTPDRFGIPRRSNPDEVHPGCETRGVPADRMLAQSLSLVDDRRDLSTGRIEDPKADTPRVNQGISNLRESSEQGGEGSKAKPSRGEFARLLDAGIGEPGDEVHVIAHRVAKTGGIERRMVGSRGVSPPVVLCVNGHRRVVIVYSVAVVAYAGRINRKLRIVV
jgi:hypothetical protein